MRSIGHVRGPRHHHRPGFNQQSGALGRCLVCSALDMPLHFGRFKYRKSTLSTEKYMQVYSPASLDIYVGDWESYQGTGLSAVL